MHRRVSQRARPQRRIGYTSAPPGARSSTTHSTLPCVTIFFTPRVCPPFLWAPPMVEGGGELQGPGTPARPMRCRVLAPAAPNTSQAPPSPAMGGWGLVRSRAPPAPRGTYSTWAVRSARQAHPSSVTGKKKRDGVRLQ